MNNQYGLSRDIPENVKRIVRQRCGFGCVICGCAIVEYDHFHPEFRIAKLHDPDGITLLCPTCHRMKTNNLISIRRIHVANQNPAAKLNKYALFDLAENFQYPNIIFGTSAIYNCRIPLMIRGVPLVQFDTPEENGGPYRLSAAFYNQQNQLSLYIYQNEWRVYSDAWDVEVAGSSVIVRKQPKEVTLNLEIIPGEGVIVKKLKMTYMGFVVDCDGDNLETKSPGGGGISFSNCAIVDCGVGLSLG